MAARNKNIPALRFKEFKGNWEIKKLSELLEFKNGINASKEQYGRGVKFINVLDILNNDFITHDAIIGSVDVDEKVLEKYPVNYGDILFQRSSETREEVGTACVYLDSKTATFGGFVIRGRKIGDYDPIFLNKLLKTDLSRNEITSKSGGSTRYNVGQETLSSVALPFPSLPEQQKIASFLSAIDEKIRQLTRRKELLEEYKKGVMQQLFSGKLRFKDEHGKAYPKWEEKRLEDISLKIQDGTHFSPKSSESGDYYYLTSKNIKNGYIDLSSAEYVSKEDHDSIYKRCNVRKGDVLLTKDGTIGQVCVNKLDKPFSLLSSVAFIRVKKDYSNDFLYQILVSPIGQREISNSIAGQALKRITLSKINNFKYLFPSFREQQKIASFLSGIDTKIECVSAQIEGTKGYKKGLLQKMFV